MTWGSINLNAGSGKLPPPGTYPATVADLRLHEKPDVLWCAVQFSLDGMAAAPRDVVHAIAARETASTRAGSPRACGSLTGCRRRLVSRSPVSTTTSCRGS